MDHLVETKGSQPPMVASTDPMLLKLADIVETELFRIQGVARGYSPKTHEVAGLWSIKCDLVVTVDEESPQVVSAFVRVIKDLWAYVVVSREGAWLLWFDNNRAKISVGGEHHFGTRKGLQTLKRLEPYITCALTWRADEWVSVDVKSLIAV